MRIAAAAFLLLAACVHQEGRATRSTGERASWQSVACTSQPVVCHRMEAQGYFFAQPGASAAVLVSHGSQGLDQRLFEYADALREAGFAALVIDTTGRHAASLSLTTTMSPLRSGAATSSTWHSTA